MAICSASQRVHYIEELPTVNNDCLDCLEGRIPLCSSLLRTWPPYIYLFILFIIPFQIHSWGTMIKSRQQTCTWQQIVARTQRQQKEITVDLLNPKICCALTIFQRSKTSVYVYFVLQQKRVTLTSHQTTPFSYACDTCDTKFMRLWLYRSRHSRRIHII